jgi:hypothetical protein
MSIINSREQFSYAQVQNIIGGGENFKWKDDILNLFNVSKSLRQKRVGDGMFSIPYEFELPENEENNSNYPEAYYLIEELMILTNHQQLGGMPFSIRLVFLLAENPDILKEYNQEICAIEKMQSNDL